METYSFLRELADSWVLLAMFLFFVGVAIWAFLPSQSAAREDARMIPFKGDDRRPATGSRTGPAAKGKGKSDV